MKFFLIPAFDCIHPVAQNFILAFCVLLILNLMAFIFAKPLVRRLRIAAAILFVSIIIAAWLGSYTYSPIFGFADGRNSVLSGFRISRTGRADVIIAPGGTISLGRGTYTSITALVTTENANCLWMSTNGGSWETPDSCEPVYVPPQTSFFDVIKVRVVPGCQLPQTVGQIKISVLP